jgi:UDP-N-acetylglucosamine 4,6-dehydratase
MSTYDCGKYYVITPSVASWNLNDWIKRFNAKLVPEGFKYNSGTNPEWLDVNEIREQIKKHIDPNFKE